MDLAGPLLVVAALAFVNAFGHTLASVKLFNPEKLRALQEEVKDYREQLEAAKKSSDTKLLKSLEKRKKYIDTLSSDVSSATLKQTMASLAITLSVFYFMLWLYPQGQVVAIIPTYLINPQDGLIMLDPVFWFMISTMFFSTAARKALGLS